MSVFAYAVACVLLPSLWAVAMFYVFGWVDRRRAAAMPGSLAAPPAGDDELPPADYMI